MKFPDFFAAAPAIRMRDPLAEFLGAAEGGRIEYRYAVRLAGICPTVASAFLMTRTALKALYGEELPVRGDRVTGAAPRCRRHRVIASVATLITGATADSGFHGLAGRFNRRDSCSSLRRSRQANWPHGSTAARLSRCADLSRGQRARTGELMPLCLTGWASEAQTAEFRALWQDRVRRLLLDHADDADVFVLFPQP
jgi:hypothetical protein